MKANIVIISGTHNSQSAKVTFTYIGRKIWCATIDCGGKVIDFRSKQNNGLRPCPTHAGYLLDKHFPKPGMRKRPFNLSRERERRNAANRSVVRHPRVTVYNGDGNEDLK